MACKLTVLSVLSCVIMCYQGWQQHSYIPCLWYRVIQCYHVLSCVVRVGSGTVTFHASYIVLPLPGDLKYIWQDVHNVIDDLHIRNHKDPRCKKYSAEPLREEYPHLNTMACEQTFVWLSRLLGWGEGVGLEGKKTLAFMRMHAYSPLFIKTHWKKYAEQFPLLDPCMHGALPSPSTAETHVLYMKKNEKKEGQWDNSLVTSTVMHHIQGSHSVSDTTKLIALLSPHNQTLHSGLTVVWAMDILGLLKKAFGINLTEWFMRWQWNPWHINSINLRRSNSYKRQP